MTNESTELSTYSSKSTSLILDTKSFESIMAFANMMSNGIATVPKHLQKNPSDCAAIVMQAMQWNMNPYAVAQKTHIVNGTLGYEAQLVNAVVTASGLIDGTFKYEYLGENEEIKCRVGAKLKDDSDITWTEWLAIKDVTVRNSPLWKTNKKQQIGYLQLKNWSRLYAAGAILGVHTVDELQDSVSEIKIINPEEPVTATQTAELEENMYPEDEFKKNIDAWRKLIASGRSTAEQIIQKVSSKGKLTDTQKEKIKNVNTVIEGQSETVETGEQA